MQYEGGELYPEGYIEGTPIESCASSLHEDNITEPQYLTMYATAFYNSMLLIQGEHIDPKSVNEKVSCRF